MNAVVLFSMLVIAVATASGASLNEEMEPVRTRLVRIAVPVSKTTTLSVGAQPGNALSMFPNSDLLTQYMPGFMQDALTNVPRFGFGIEVNTVEKQRTPGQESEPRTRRPRRH